MEYPKNLDPRATPAYRGAWSTPKMCQYSGCYHAKFGDFWLNGIIIITDGGSDVRFHADVGVYEHAKVSNSGGGLLLLLGVYEWCHQLTECMIPVNEPRKTSPTPVMTF